MPVGVTSLRKYFAPAFGVSVNEPCPRFTPGFSASVTVSAATILPVPSVMKPFTSAGLLC